MTQATAPSQGWAASHLQPPAGSASLMLKTRKICGLRLRFTHWGPLFQAAGFVQHTTAAGAATGTCGLTAAEDDLSRALSHLGVATTIPGRVQPPP